MTEAFSCHLCAGPLSGYLPRCNVCGWTHRCFDPRTQAREFRAYRDRLRVARERRHLLGHYDQARVLAPRIPPAGPMTAPPRTHMTAVGADLL